MLNVQSLEKIPIPEPDNKTEKRIENLVERIIEGKKKEVDTSELENQIDKIVYGLYNLEKGKIKIVERGL